MRQCMDICGSIRLWRILNGLLCPSTSFPVVNCTVSSEVETTGHALSVPPDSPLRKAIVANASRRSRGRALLAEVPPYGVCIRPYGVHGYSQFRLSAGEDRGPVRHLQRLVRSDSCLISRSIAIVHRVPFQSCADPARRQLH